MADNINSLAEEARKRKEKLLALKVKKEEKKDAPDNQESKTQAEEDDPETREPPAKVIKFRNYKPKDDTLQEKKLPDAKPLQVEEDLEEHLKKGEPEVVVEEVDLTNLAPRKPDWDLKRDVAKKLEKLERRTQRAIVELIRDRLKSSDEDLATAVNAMTEGRGSIVEQGK